MHGLIDLLRVRQSLQQLSSRNPRRQLVGHNPAIGKAARPDCGALDVITPKWLAAGELPSRSQIKIPVRCRQAHQSWLTGPGSAELIRYFGDAALGTGLLLLPSRRGSAQADAADGVLTDFDRDAAGERNDVGKHSLPGKCRFGARRPFGRRLSEGQSRISL